MIIKTVCLSPDSTVVLAYSTSQGLFGWHLDSEADNGMYFGHLFPVSEIGDSPILMTFLNCEEAMIVSGQTGIIVNVANFSPVSNNRPQAVDAAYVVRRISLPCRCHCMDTLDSKILLSGETGEVYTIDYNGRVLSSFTVPESTRVQVLRVVRENCLLVGTHSDILQIDPSLNNLVQSSYKLPHGMTIRHLTIDNRRNWFSAVIASTAFTGGLIVGSTKCLSSVFESPETDTMYVSQSNFVETLSNGLSILASGPTPQLLLLPLDLSSAIPRLQLDPKHELSSVVASHSSPKGDLIVLGGVGDSVVLLSPQTLSIVRRFSLN